MTTLLVAGAAAAGGEAVKEATKDAYEKLKGAVGGLFGARATKAVAKIEEVGTEQEGRQELERYLPEKLDPDEATQIQPFVEALVRALNEDSTARQVVHARVGLDIEAGGNAFVRDIQGAREIAAKIRAKQDVTVEGLRMDTGRDPGK